VALNCLPNPRIPAFGFDSTADIQASDPEWRLWVESLRCSAVTPNVRREPRAACGMSASKARLGGVLLADYLLL
jgi:hypothetical protein